MFSQLRLRSMFCLALCSLSACAGEAPAETGSDTGALALPGRGVAALVVTNVDDPMGVGSAAARKTSVIIRSAAAYRAAFGHAAPASVKFNEGEVVIFYSDGVKPTGGYTASIVSVVQIGRALSVATHLSAPGEGCITTDALTSPYALVKVKPRGRTYKARFQHLRSTDDCAPATCDELVCESGQHCELQEIVCITTPCDPIPTCVDDTTSPPFCGGFAGFPCPGQGECVDDPSDDCDPSMGGADCGGLCTCPVVGLCEAGFMWNDAPEVCDCVAAENPCNLVDCMPGNVCIVEGGEATCVPDTGGGTNPCAFTLCPINTECVVSGGEAVCKPIRGSGGEACGDTTCGDGLVCCNSSCGICTPPGGACIQIACL